MRIPLWQRKWFLAVVLAALTILVFWPVARAQFIDWDDWFALAENPDFMPVNWHRIGLYWLHGAFALYAPLSYSVWAVLAWCQQQWRHSTGLSPSLFHIANLTVHLIAAELVFLLLLRLIARPLPALLGAIIFAIHPLQVEPISWVISINTLLSGMLAILALWMYLHFAGQSEFLRGTSISPSPSTPGEGRGEGSSENAGSSNLEKTLTLTLSQLTGRGDKTRRLWWFVGSCLALALALCAKAQAIPAVGLAWVIEVMVLRRPLRKYWWPILVWGVITVPFVVIGRAIQPPFEAAQTPVWTRPLIAADTLAFYFAKLVWPAHLTIDYQRQPVWVMESGRIWVTWIVPAAVGFLACWYSRRLTNNRESQAVPSTHRGGGAPALPANGRPLLLAGLAMMLVAISPTSGIVGFSFQRYSTVGDRYMYLGMVGIALCVASLASFAKGKGFWIIAAIAVGMLMARSAVRVRHWHDTLSLTVAAKNPNDNCALDHRIHAFALGKLHRFGEAIEQYQLAIRYDDMDSTTFYDFANLLVRIGRPAAAIPNYRRAIELEPGKAQFHHNYAVALMAVGDWKRAGEEFLRATELDPESAEAREDYAKWKGMQKH